MTDTKTGVRSKANPMARYFVCMRQFERQLIRDALEATGNNVHEAAAILEVEVHYVKARAKWLGAVIGEEPLHEPPGLAAAAWNATAPSGLERKRAKEAKAKEEAKNA